VRAVYAGRLFHQKAPAAKESRMAHWLEDPSSLIRKNTPSVMDQSAIVFSGDDLAEVTVVDPSGQKTGYTAQEDAFQIPQSFFRKYKGRPDNCLSGFIQSSTRFEYCRWSEVSEPQLSAAARSAAVLRVQTSATGDK